MRHRSLLLAPAAAALLLMGAGPSPRQVTVADLLADPAPYSETVVAVQGELVGDFGERSDGTVWTQLNGDAYAAAPLRAGGSLAGANLGIGVAIPAGLWPGWEDPGGYRVRGPVVELTGTWRYHDPGRGGESYLDVTGVVLLEGPLALEEGVRWLPLGVGAGLLGLALGVGLLTRRRTS